MAHFAQIDTDNVVIRVVVIDNEKNLNQDGVEDESVGALFCTSLFGGTWIQTSYNHNFRKRYAQVGGTYDPAADCFIDAKPSFNSWILNEDKVWVPPVPYPQDYNFYEWDETIVNWKLITDNSADLTAERRSQLQINQLINSLEE